MKKEWELLFKQISKEQDFCKTLEGCIKTGNTNRAALKSKIAEQDYDDRPLDNKNMRMQQ